MNVCQLQPPGDFKFSTPGKWPIWFQRFETYRKASGLAQKSEDTQVSTLIYVMGSEAEEIVNSLKLSDADLLCNSAVCGAFNSHFVPKRNLI